jgi:hypothetical protein
MNTSAQSNITPAADSVREFLTARVREQAHAMVPHTSLVASYFEWCAGRKEPGDATTLREQLVNLFPSVSISLLETEVIYVGVRVDANGPVGLAPINPHLPA